MPSTWSTKCCHYDCEPVEYWSWSRRQSSRFTRGIINGLLWKQFVTSRGTMVDISARMSSTSDAVTSALNWRASLTASLYNQHNVLGDTNSKVGDDIWHTEIWPQLSVLWKTSSMTTTILWRPSLAHQASAGRLMLCFCYLLSFLLLFTARRNARIASAVLATAIRSVCPSVCPSVRPSVTRRYCVKTTARSTVQFALSDSKMCLVF